MTGRNPNWEEEDALRIRVGANDGGTDRIVQLNPFGAYSIEKAVHVTYQSQPIYPYADEWKRSVLYRDADKFLVATSRNATEWDAEVAIPLNQLSAPESDNVYVIWVSFYSGTTAPLASARPRSVPLRTASSSCKIPFQILPKTNISFGSKIPEPIIL